MMASVHTAVVVENSTCEEPYMSHQSTVEGLAIRISQSILIATLMHAQLIANGESGQNGKIAVSHVGQVFSKMQINVQLYVCFDALPGNIQKYQVSDSANQMVGRVELFRRTWSRGFEDI